MRGKQRAPFALSAIRRIHLGRCRQAYNPCPMSIACYHKYVIIHMEYESDVKNIIQCFNSISFQFIFIIHGGYLDGIYIDSERRTAQLHTHTCYAHTFMQAHKASMGEVKSIAHMQNACVTSKREQCGIARMFRLAICIHLHTYSIGGTGVRTALVVLRN